MWADGAFVDGAPGEQPGNTNGEARREHRQEPANAVAVQGDAEGAVDLREAARERETAINERASHATERAELVGQIDRTRAESQRATDAAKANLARMAEEWRAELVAERAAYEVRSVAVAKAAEVRVTGTRVAVAMALAVIMAMAAAATAVAA